MKLIDKLKDPTLELLARQREIERAERERSNGNMDDKELAEREEAAKAYAGEKPEHFASFLQDCVDQSVTANAAIRETQAHCYRVYQENEPVNYAKKESWQSRIVVPKPYGTVQSGASAIKRAFTPKFLSVQNTRNKTHGEFWKKTLEYYLNEDHAKFILKFTDATTMGLAVGISQEMIPQWIPGKGLAYTLAEPWKIHRDPDAASRDPQSGLYWIHQEWLDYYVLKAAQTAGKYQNIDQLKNAESPDPNNHYMTQEAIAARKNMIWQRSRYRPMILTSEFWGMVLSPKGEMLLPSARFTCAAGRVIEPPKAVPYNTLRWPGIAFSPLPDLLKFNGRGLLEGILTLWEAMCNMLCLHQDNMQWIVNPMTEINVDALVDPADTETYPGKEYLVKDTVSGQQAVRQVQRRSNTNDILANLQYHDQNYQRGSFVNDAVQGLPGYRKDMTYREAAMNMDQALGVYSLMGENIEAGAIAAVSAGAEFIARYVTYADLLQIFSEEELADYGIERNPTPEPGSITDVAGLPPVDGTFHISGIQSLMKENEALTNIKQILIPLAGNARFAPYLKPYKILKSFELRTNLTDEDLIVDQGQAKLIEAQEWGALAQQATAEAEAQAQAQAEAQAKQSPEGAAPGAENLPASAAPENTGAEQV